MNSNEDTVCRRHSLVYHHTPHPIGTYEYEYEVYQPTVLSDKLNTMKAISIV